MVGLYGDPDVTWSILLELELDDSLDSLETQERARQLAADWPHLGRTPTVRTVSEGWEAMRHTFANKPYGPQDALVRVALGFEGHRLLVAAHHGAMDGVGLIATASALSGRTLRSRARGLSGRKPRGGFVSGSLRRLGEALVSPPARFSPEPGEADEPRSGDVLLATALMPGRPDTAALVLGASRLLQAWNDEARRRGGRRVVAVALSRRSGAHVLAPDRDTAYARVRTDSLVDLEGARALVEGLVPEPDFPVSDGRGLGPRLTRLLGSRLGSSVLVSNLGELTGAGVVGASFWPSASGPNGVCLGLVSAGDKSTLTLRARRPWFGIKGAVRMLLQATAHVETAMRGRSDLGADRHADSQ